MAFDYDLFVIGSGSAAIAASRKAATYGVRVGVVEQEDIGGTKRSNVIALSLSRCLRA